MSLVNPEKLGVTLVEDPRVSFPEWTIPSHYGGDSISYNQVSASSIAGAGGTTLFTVKPSAPNSAVIAPNMIWYNKGEFAIDITPRVGGAGNLLQQGNTDAPRAYPFTSCVDTLNVTLNNASITLPNWSMIGHAIRRFNPRAAMYKASNFCPWFPDQCANYSGVIATNRNPLGAGAVGDFDFTRGAYQRVTYTPAAGNAGQVQGTVVLETWEPINISPLMYDMQGKGLPYVQTLQLDFTMSGLFRALSHAVGQTNNIPILNGDITSNITASKLFFQQITLPMFARSIATIVSLPLYRLVTSTSSSQAVTVGTPAIGAANPAGTNFTSDLISYPEIPSRIYVFVQPAKEERTIQTPDYTLMYTQGLQVTWGINTYMSNVTPQQLYTSAVDGGFAFPWEAFAGSYVQGGSTVGTSGSVLCLRPSIDFPLEEGQSVGMAGQFNFQVAANFHNQAPAAVAPLVDPKCQMWVVAVLPGVLSLTSKFDAIVTAAAISSADVLKAADEESGDRVSPSEVQDAFGSGIFDSIKSALPLLRKAGRAHSGLSAAKNAGLLGEGGSAMSGGGVTTGGAASMYGGARLSKHDLAARMR